MINRTDILQELYESITIPEYVYEEFLKPPTSILKYINYMIEINFLKVNGIETDKEYEIFFNLKEIFILKKL